MTSKPIHVYPTSEEPLHVVDSYPEKLCWCAYRVEDESGTPIVVHERRDN